MFIKMGRLRIKFNDELGLEFNEMQLCIGFVRGAETLVDENIL
jgi:hypothetical protein